MIDVYVAVKRSNILLRSEDTGTERILECDQDIVQSKAKLWSDGQGINTRRLLNMQFTFCDLIVEMVLMQGKSHYITFGSASSILDGFDDFSKLSMKHATLVRAGSPQTIPTPVN